ncbi:MAG: hypothetical protein ACK4TA_08170 [Saprospiraceae bacterium]
MRISQTGWIAGGMGLLFSLLIGDGPWSALGLGLVLLVVFDFLYKVGRTFPLLELIALIAVLQLILGPYFSYRLPVSYFRYVMYIPEDSYMQIAVWAHSLFIVGMMLVKQPLDLSVLRSKIEQFTARHPLVSIHLMAGGVGAVLLQPFAPAALGFVFYLAINLVYVGGILYYFSVGKRYRLGVYLATLGFALIQASASGVFHDFLLWTVLGLALIAINIKISLLTKTSVLAIGVLLLMALQSVKTDYRAALAAQRLSAGDRISLLVNYISGALTNMGDNFTPKKLSGLNVRLNQGWITSAIMQNVPRNVPFAGGRTILESLEAAFLPRILFPNKKQAGGRENYRLYTGIPIEDNTSMGIGLLGEAYVNFGWGAGLFLLVWGWLLAKILASLAQLSFRYNVLLFFMIPVIFLQVIKAETEFYVVLNHMIKAFMFTAFIYVVWFARYK